MSKVKLWQNIRKNISNCEVSWPHSLSLWIVSWGKRDDATGNNSVLSGRWAGWVIWKLLLYTIMHFSSLSRNPTTVSGTYLWTCVFQNWQSFSIAFAGCFLSPHWPVSLVSASGGRAISYPYTHSLWNWSPAHVRSSFWVVCRVWLWLEIELQKYHMHTLKKAHLVFSVSCQILCLFCPFQAALVGLCGPCRWARGGKPGKPSPWVCLQTLHCLGSPTNFLVFPYACFPNCKVRISH